MFKLKGKALVIFLITLGVALLIFIRGLDRSFLPPFTTSVKLEQTRLIIHSDTEGIAVDSLGERVLFFDENQKLVNFINLNLSGSPIKNVTDAHICNGKIYLLGYSTLNDGINIESESVLVYDKKGKFEKELYKVNYKEEDCVTNCRFRDITVVGDTLYLVHFADKIATLLTYKNFDMENPIAKSWNIGEYAHRINYSLDNNTILLLSRTQRLYNINCATDEIEDFTLYSLIDKESNKKMNFLKNGFVNLETQNAYPRVTVDNGGNIKYVTYMYADDNGDMEILSSGTLQRDVEITILPYSTEFLIMSFIHYFVLLYIILASIFIIINLLSEKILTKMVVPVIFMIGIIFTASYYSNSMHNNLETSYKKTIKDKAWSVSTATSKLLNFNDKYFDKGKFLNEVRTGALIDSIETLQSILAQFCSSRDGKTDYYLNLYYVGDDKNIFTFIDSFNGEPIGIQLNISDEDKEKIFNGEEFFTEKITSNSKTVYTYSTIKDSSGMDVMVVGSGYKEKNLIANQQNQSLELFINFLSILIVVVVACTTLSGNMNDIKRFFARKDNEVLGKMTDILGTYSFVIGFVVYMDSIIQVLVAQSLSAGYDQAVQAILMAMPFSAKSLGGVFGKTIFTKAIRKYKKRTIGIFGVVATFISFVLMIVAILRVNIFIYIFAKLIFGIFETGFLYNLTNIIPLDIKDEKEKKKVMSDIQKDNTASSIISVILGGYVSQYLSYVAIYILAIFFLAILFVIILVGFSSKEVLKVEKAVETSKKESLMKILQVTFCPAMLMYYLCYYLPKSIITAYPNYIFPLYTASCGLSVALLSNLNAFSKAFGYLTNDVMLELTSKIESSKSLVISMLVLSISFICFFFCPNIYWAIVVLFLIALMRNMSNLGGKLYVADVGESVCGDAALLTNTSGIVISGISVVETPILSTILTLGYNVACTVIGIGASVLFSLFGLAQKKYLKKTNGEHRET